MTVSQKLGVILESKVVQKTIIDYVISMHASNVTLSLIIFQFFFRIPYATHSLGQRA